MHLSKGEYIREPIEAENFQEKQASIKLSAAIVRYLRPSHPFHCPLG